MRRLRSCGSDNGAQTCTDLVVGRRIGDTDGDNDGGGKGRSGGGGGGGTKTKEQKSSQTNKSRRANFNLNQHLARAHVIATNAALC